MSFNGKETSAQDGRPVSLYEFMLDTLAFRYTNADHDITYDGNVYSAVAVSDQGSAQGGGDGNGEELSIDIDADTDVAGLFEGTPPSELLWIKKRRLHLDDGEAVISWIGLVGSCVWKNAAVKTIQCRSLLASMQRSGLRLSWERNCPHMLYGPGCNRDDTLDAEAWAFDTNVINYDSDGTGNNITFFISNGNMPVPELPGGFLSWDIGGGVVERRGILRKIGPNIWGPGAGTYYTFELLGGNGGLSEGLAIRVYPGCDRTTGDKGCTAFANTDNFGGFPHQPGKSPFDGSPIF